jgi:hypothetical protein
MRRETSGGDVGFCGLGALATQIDAALLAADELAKIPMQAPPASEPVEPETVDRDLGAIAGFGRLLKAGAGFAIAIAVVVGVKALIAMGLSSSSMSDDQPRPYSEPYDSSAALGTPDEGTTPPDDMSVDSNLAADLPVSTEGGQGSTYEPPASAEDIGGMGEQRPTPSDLGTTYSAAQVRYCVAEDVRMNGAKEYADRLSTTDPAAFNRIVEPFNDMVGDYNNRCSRFYYDQSQMMAIRGSVESRRSSLEAEGRRRLQ